MRAGDNNPPCITNGEDNPFHRTQHTVGVEPNIPDKGLVWK